MAARAMDIYISTIGLALKGNLALEHWASFGLSGSILDIL